MPNQKKYLVFLSAIALFSLLAIYWIFRGPDGNTKLGNPTTILSSGNPTKPLRRTDPDRSEAGLNSILTTPRNNAELDAMISNSTDKLGATVAAFIISIDDKYLEELAKFSDSPKACTLLACFSKTPEEKARWADKLLQFDASNKLAILVKARCLLSSNKEGEALILASQLAMPGKFQIPEMELLADVSAGWRGLGYDETTAKRLAVYNGSNGSFSSFFKEAINSVWDARLKSPMSEEALIDAATEQLGIVSNFRAALRPAIEVDIFTRKMEQGVLEQLPADVEFGREDYTVEDYKRDVQLRNQELAKDFRVLIKAISAASPEVLDKYYDKCFLEGNASGSAWLLDIEKSQAPDGK